MSGHGVPSNYLGATDLGPDANACLAMARAKWHTLSKTQRRALVDAQSIVSSVWLPAGTGSPTRNALVRQGLADAKTTSCHNGRAALTGFGVMVREAGVYTRTEAAT